MFVKFVADIYQVIHSVCFWTETDDETEQSCLSNCIAQVCFNNWIVRTVSFKNQH